MQTLVAEVLFNGRVAGILQRSGPQYSFVYAADYLQTDQPAISLTLPKRAEAFVAPVLFSFFYGLLAEGIAKQIQHCTDVGRINTIPIMYLRSR